MLLLLLLLSLFWLCWRFSGDENTHYWNSVISASNIETEMLRVVWGVICHTSMLGQDKGSTGEGLLCLAFPQQPGSNFPLIFTCCAAFSVRVSWRVVVIYLSVFIKVAFFASFRVFLGLVYYSIVGYNVVLFKEFYSEGLAHFSG